MLNQNNVKRGLSACRGELAIQVPKPAAQYTEQDDEYMTKPFKDEN